MSSKIKELIMKGDYDKALKLIESQLSQEADLSNPQQEEAHIQLINFRITANTLKGENDDLVLDAIRQKRFVAMKDYHIGRKHKIQLYYRNILNVECDALVTNISADKYFDVEPNTATYRFVQKVGTAEIEKQMKKQYSKQKGDFIILHHDKLLQPLSYHIISKESDEPLNLDVLSVGIQRVLNDARNRGLKKIAFSALGIGELRRLPESDRPQRAEAIAHKIADTIVMYMMDRPDDKCVPEVIFAFVDPRTAQLFENVFYAKTTLPPDHYVRQRQMSERERDLIKRVGTKNAEYLDILKNVNNFIDETSVILITGETGVGKSRLAKTIHDLRGLPATKFVSMNCASAQRDLVYSTLFGSEKGAYSGAEEKYQGYIELAENGTMFLDEIGDADISVQNALLTFLDEGRYRRLRGKEDLTSNAKIIFGTNKDLAELVRKNIFRADLYARIHQRIISIPPLRKRPEDIKILVDSLMSKWNKSQDRSVHLEPSAVDFLMEQKWYGNLRELDHYLSMKYHDAVYDGTYNITTTKLQIDPPKTGLRNNEARLLGIIEEIIITLLKLSMEKYKKQKSEIESSTGNKIPADTMPMTVKLILESIAAKVYVRDLNMSKTDASIILGIDGSKGANSTLKQRNDSYETVAELLKLID